MPKREIFVTELIILSGVSDLLLIVLLLIPILLIYLVVRLQSMVSISSIAGFLQTKKKVYFTA